MVSDRLRHYAEFAGIAAAATVIGAVAIGGGYVSFGEQSKEPTPTSSDPVLTGTSLPELPTATTVAVTVPAATVTPLPNTGWQCTGPNQQFYVDNAAYFASTNQYSVNKSVSIATGDSQIKDLSISDTRTNPPRDLAHLFAADMASINNVSAPILDDFPESTDVSKIYNVPTNCTDPKTGAKYMTGPVLPLKAFEPGPAN